MTTNWKDVARATLEGSESGTTTFPQSLRDLIEAGFDGYAVDFRRSTRTYYMPNGETLELKTVPTPTPLAEAFDAVLVREGIGGLRGLPARSTGALLRPHLRDPYGVLPRDAARKGRPQSAVPIGSAVTCSKPVTP
jgi:hypothetical protein